MLSQETRIATRKVLPVVEILLACLNCSDLQLMRFRAWMYPSHCAELETDSKNKVQVEVEVVSVQCKSLKLRQQASLFSPELQT
jgi:hypothetical protein